MNFTCVHASVNTRVYNSDLSANCQLSMPWLSLISTWMYADLGNGFAQVENGHSVYSKMTWHVRYTEKNSHEKTIRTSAIASVIIYFLLNINVCLPTEKSIIVLYQ